MHTDLTLPHPPKLQRMLCRLGAAALLALTAGCQSLPLTRDAVIGPSYQVENRYQSVFWLPSDVKRVAVLPLTWEKDQSDLTDGAQILWPVLLDELRKTRQFDVRVVSSEELRAWTGKDEWRTQESLPLRLMTYLRKELGCDAVLFSRLTRFHAYPPQMQGYDLQLVRLSDPSDPPVILWAVDEVFDAGEQSVENGARRYAKTTSQHPASLTDSRFILNSPSRFGHYALAAIFDTFPER